MYVITVMKGSDLQIQINEFLFSFPCLWNANWKIPYLKYIVCYTLNLYLCKNDYESLIKFCIIGILLNYKLLYWTINLNLNLDETVNFEIISINSATAVTMSFVLQTFQLTFKSFVKQLHFNIVQMQYDSSWMI